MMNRKERVMTVLQGGKPDRTPVCFWHHFGNLEPAETVKAHLRWLEESGQDILKMMCDEFFVYPLGDADTPEAYAALKPQGRDSYYVRGQVERATQINEALKGEVVTFYNAFSPYATLKHAIGQDRAMDLMRKHPDAARHLLDIIEEDTVYIIEGILKESGTTGMMLCLQGAEEGLFTDEEYAAFLRRGEEAIVYAADRLSKVNLLHLCGWDGIPDRLDRWKDYPGCIVNWDVDVEHVKLEDGKDFFPGRTLLGGFNNRPGSLLQTGSREEVKAFTKQLIRTAGTQRYIIGADCSLPADIDRQRIRWVLEASSEMVRNDLSDPGNGVPKAMGFMGKYSPG